MDHSFVRLPLYENMYSISSLFAGSYFDNLKRCSESYRMVFIKLNGGKIGSPLQCLCKEKKNIKKIMKR